MGSMRLSKGCRGADMGVPTDPTPPFSTPHTPIHDPPVPHISPCNPCPKAKSVRQLSIPPVGDVDYVLDLPWEIFFKNGVVF